MKTQRYAKDADGRPVLEVVTWQSIPGHARAQGEEQMVWVSGSNIFADLASLVTKPEVDEITGVTLDPGGHPTVSDEEFGNLFALPLREGLTLIERDEYAALMKKEKD